MVTIQKDVILAAFIVQMKDILELPSSSEPSGTIEIFR